MGTPYSECDECGGSKYLRYESIMGYKDKVHGKHPHVKLDAFQQPHQRGMIRHVLAGPAPYWTALDDKLGALKLLQSNVNLAVPRYQRRFGPLMTYPL